MNGRRAGKTELEGEGNLGEMEPKMAKTARPAATEGGNSVGGIGEEEEHEAR